jgi:hypothetical protein
VIHIAMPMEKEIQKKEKKKEKITLKRANGSSILILPHRKQKEM